jgi:hypothetical protein
MTTEEARKLKPGAFLEEYHDDEEYGGYFYCRYVILTNDGSELTMRYIRENRTRIIPDYHIKFDVLIAAGLLPLEEFKRIA